MRLFIISSIFAATILTRAQAAAENLNWPEKQLLAKFPAPAETLDCIDLDSFSGDEEDLFTSLEGIVNRTEPRIVTVGRGGEGKFTWLDAHHLKFQAIDGYDALAKYRDNVKGLVVTDPHKPDTLNLATTIAGVKDELICAPELLGKLTNAPFHFSIVDDLRGKFADKYEVYDFLYSNYWSQCTHRVFAGMGTRLHGHLRDYLIGVKAATVWLSPGKLREAALLKKFVSDMKPSASVYMGWWPGEGDGLEWIAQYGVPVLASDFLRNATVFSGVNHPIRVPAIPPPPPLENKIYVSLMLSDGDNIQYMQHAMRMFWNDPMRGTLPIGWTTSPLTVDLDPAMMDYFWSTATTNDCLVSGPSGAGYGHINHWSPEHLDLFSKVSAPYLDQSGLRIITVWDRVNDKVARAFATNCPNLLGLTDQGMTWSKVTHGQRTIRLTPAYSSSVEEMVKGISGAAAHWNGSAPVFIAAQSDVWHLGPQGLAEIAKALDPAKYKLVRPDHLFMLANESAAKKK